MNQARFRIVGATDVGQKRPENEDYLIFDEDLGVVVLADGMGGHNAGEIASQMVATSVMDELSTWLRKSKPATIRDNLNKAVGEFINRANEKVFRDAALNPSRRGMGTTLLLTVYYEGRLTVAHVGDSRAYLFRNNRLISLTKDHSKVQELIDRGLILKEDGYKSPFSNVLTRAVGVQEEVAATFTEIDLEVGDKTIFCSDGLTNMVSDGQIEKMFLTEAPLVDTLHSLIGAANRLGGHDNITVVVGGYDFNL